MRVLLLSMLLCAMPSISSAQPVLEDKYFGPEQFNKFSLGECRVTEFNPHIFHFRCHSHEAFIAAHDALISVRKLSFGGYTRDFRDLPEYMSYWVDLRKQVTYKQCESTPSVISN